MSTYVMSDIHGHFDEFLSILNLIEFKDEDTLYILGDIIDRGTKSLLLFDYIISHKNIILLKGNHEELFENFYLTGNTSLWFDNGGNTTYTELLSKDDYYIDTMYKYIRKLPTIKLIDNFILVHAELFYPEDYNEFTIYELIQKQYNNRKINLWGRDNIKIKNKLDDYIIISGHTPTQQISPSFESKILNRNGLIYIDCGIYQESDGKLACLRLDDMKEFYINRII